MIMKREDVLGLLYISCSNMRNRKAAGSYYTPTKIVRKAVDQLFRFNDEKGKLLDPCCGTGNFLLQLPDNIPMEQIYGSDINPVSVMIARINMALRFFGCDVSMIERHIQVKDFLEVARRDSSSVQKGICQVITDNTGEESYLDDMDFDYIIGNPPWGYNYSEQEKSELRTHFQCAMNAGFKVI